MKPEVGRAGRPPRIGVLGLQGAVRQHLEAVRAVGAVPVEVRLPRDLVDLDALILPGGESTTMTLGVEREGLREPLRDFATTGAPVLGTCAGMIMLDREHLGIADWSCRRNAFGSQIRSFEADLRLPVPGPPVRAVFIRAPWVESVGDGVEVLAAVPGGGPAAGRVVAVRQGPVMATSFHPELTGDDRVHELFVKMVKEAQR